ncbi:MAG: DNA-protecting protein DprA [Candidatus Mycalebacterium zealandia]|nr:MAG: DNA-protecting protein DprA [Candidatus Mycalebacterium zealandia]
MDEKSCFIALSFIKGLGDVLISRLVEGCGSAENVFKQARTPGALARIGGIGPETEKIVKNFSDWQKVEKEISEARKRDFEILTLSDDRYPENLKQIYSAPAVLYVFGEIKKRDLLSVAIVGSRSPSKYGTDSATFLSSELAAVGVCVVSGMARGIDSSAHKAAINAGGRTVAVLGSGLDFIYPPENHELYNSIAKNGAVISAFPLGTEPDKTNFPQRNSVISGLSLGTVVIQASNKSGSLITANLALEHGREVFAVPGRIGEKMSGGTNSLIKKGAKLVENISDITEEIPLIKHLKNRTDDTSAQNSKKFASLSEEKKKTS